MPQFMAILHVINLYKPGTYTYILVCTIYTIVYWCIQIHTGTYWYIPVCTKNPDFVPLVGIPDASYTLAFHPHHGPLILRSHDTRGSRHQFQRSSHRFSAALLIFLRLPRSSSHITACRYQCFSVACRTRFPTSVPAFVPLHFGSSTTIPRLHSRKRSSHLAHAPPAPGC
jgi:hypothetical protein